MFTDGFDPSRWIKQVEGDSIARPQRVNCKITREFTTMMVGANLDSLKYVTSSYAKVAPRGNTEKASVYDRPAPRSSSEVDCKCGWHENS